MSMTFSTRGSDENRKILTQREHLGDQGVDVKIILKRSSQVHAVMCSIKVTRDGSNGCLA
jgi:hypothetical protein